MNKTSRNNTRTARPRAKNEESFRYVPIAPVAADSILEHFVAYEQRLAELEEQLRAETTMSTIDIDSL